MLPKKNNPTFWLAAALSSTLLLSALATVVLAARGNHIQESFNLTATSSILYLGKSIKTDSWKPMLQIYRGKISAPESGMYDRFFAGEVKFQYPPTSLVFFHWFPPAWLEAADADEPAEPLIQMLSWLTRLVLLLTAVCSIIILEKSIGASGRFSPVYFILGLALCLTYYPLMRAYELGQVQIFIGLFAALAILFSLKGPGFWAGACLALCCFIKPPFSLLLVWALLRRKWRFVLGFLSVFSAGLAVSVFYFGWQDHLQYLEVLRAISLRGEAFWTNQSVNGLLNRWLGNGDTFVFSDTEYAPHHPFVYKATVLSSLVFLGLALWPGKKKAGEGRGAVDMLATLIASTLASPIVWEHHYGTFLPIFAFVLPPFMREKPFGRATGPLLLLSYIALAQTLLRPDLFFLNRWTGLLGVHFFLGGLILFTLVLALRANGGKNA